MKEALQALKKYFGYDEFREGQEILVRNILDGKDVLGIMPTGAGKSICYQIPALLSTGVTIVISPLISLMKDQVDSLAQTGVSVAFINSSLTLSQYRTVISNAQKNVYKIIYVAPERLENENFIELLKTIDVSIVAVDEAHCVSQWGHDFRVSYKKISHMVEQFKKRPTVVAFTATATLLVKEDIIRLLKLQNPFLLTTGFDRKNLDFQIKKPAKKIDYLKEYLKNKKTVSGIIYCITRKNVETVCETLKKQGFSCTRYHAGLSEKEKIKNQEDFITDRIQIIVATNAFGMGIDKSNIRFVVHYNMPKNIESYYQEAGRAGRDGEKAECVMFFSAADIVTNKLLIELGNEKTDKSSAYEKLNDIVNFCNTEKCLREYILNYFGDNIKIDNCKFCSNCNNEFEITDITIESQKIMSCIKRMGERFGTVFITDVLKGSKIKKINDFGFDKLSTYGIMKEYSKETIKQMISYLLAENFLNLNGEQYPVIALNEKSILVLTNKLEVKVRLEIKKEKEKEKIIEDTNLDKELFERLRKLRKEIASEENVPPFIIFGDNSLNDMCKNYPNTEEKMLAVSGVGKYKYDKYGKRFIEVIEIYMEETLEELKFS